MFLPRQGLLAVQAIMVPTGAVLAPLLLLPSSSSARQFEFTDDNIRQAVDEWLEDRGAATAQYGPITRWETWQVTDMSRLFQGATEFDENLKHWDTSSVTDMHHIFAGATSFQGTGLSNWDVRLVTDFSHAFYGATSFTGENIGTWNTSSALTMEQMFLGATNFVGPVNIEDWDTSSVTSMYAMFFEATSFDRPVNNWDMSNVRYTNSIFEGASSFSQKICWNRMDSHAKCFQCFCGTKDATFDMSSDCPVTVHPSILAYSQACDPDDILEELVESQVFGRPENGASEFLGGLSGATDTFTEGIAGLPMLSNPSIDESKEEEQEVEEEAFVGVDRSDNSGGGEEIEVADRGNILFEQPEEEDSELIIAGAQLEESPATSRWRTAKGVWTIPLLMLLSAI